MNAEPLGILVAKSFPQPWNCKIKEGTQLQRNLALSWVNNAGWHV
jgi:hypothetical protein